LTFLKTADFQSVPATSAAPRCAQAPLQKIDFQSLLADLPFQLRHPALRPTLFSITWKRVARTLSKLPAPPMQHVRVHFQPAGHLGNRDPLFQPPDGGQFKFLRELPA
jgi:hypothetical protein